MSVGDIFPTVVTPSTVAALKVSIKAERDALGLAVARCQREGHMADDSPELAQWNALSARANDYVDEDISILSSKEQVDRGQALQKDLDAFYPVLDRLGCSAGSAPNRPSSGGSDVTLFGAGIGTGLILLALVLYLSRR